ncbi:MAG TPA: hypothetical protein VMT37_16690 [Solirubrobacterales bacterium]|nr:hypothetical protein [Solirubrobacterales bacterium]
MARGRMLPAGILAAALFALLAFAPFASAANDPVAKSTTTTVNLNSSWTKYLKTFGIKIQKTGSAKLKGQKATFTATGGSLDPTTGKGTVNLNGGLKFKAGKKSVTVSALILNTSKKELSAKVGGKKVKFASIAGWSQKRNGFGVNITIKKLKLTGPAATQLNKKTGYPKGTPKPFLSGKLIGKGSSAVQPETVTVNAGGLMNLATNATTIGKLKEVGVTIPVTAPTTEPTLGTFAFPIVGGSIAPDATAGTVKSEGGLQLLQKFPTADPSKFIETEITLANVWADLGAKTLNVEVIGRSNASEKLNLGNIGRSSIADITIGGLVADPTTRTVSVTAPATLQPISAEVLNGFVAVYQAGYEAAAYAEVCENFAPEECESANPTQKAEEEAFAKKEAKKAAEEKVAGNFLKAGDPLGVVSFTAQTQ